MAHLRCLYSFSSHRVLFFFVIQVSFIGMASLEEIIGRGKVGTLDMLKVCTWILGSHFSVAVYCRHLLVGIGFDHSFFVLSLYVSLSFPIVEIEFSRGMSSLGCSAFFVG